MNITHDENTGWALILETKRKLASNLKDGTIPIFSGTFKTGKNAWRIDNILPEKWVNMVLASSDPDALNEDVEEAAYSQILAQEQLSIHNSTPLFNFSLVGERFHKKNDEKDYYQQSLYSPRAMGTLDAVLKDPSIQLTEQNKQRIATCILKALEIIHSRNEVFQDLKPENIFVYQDQAGYYAKLSDFGLCTGLKSNTVALATLGYESPEISLTHRDAKEYAQNIKNAEYFRKYFHNMLYHSYGREVSSDYYLQDTMGQEENKALAKAFYEPHAKNDMWAAGVVFYHLFTGDRLQKIDFASEKIIMNNPLLKGLLESDRKKRATANEALTLLEVSLPSLQNADLTNIDAKRLMSILEPDAKCDSLEHLSIEEVQSFLPSSKRRKASDSSENQFNIDLSPDPMTIATPARGYPILLTDMYRNVKSVISIFRFW